MMHHAASSRNAGSKNAKWHPSLLMTLTNQTRNPSGMSSWRQGNDAQVVPIHNKCYFAVVISCERAAMANQKFDRETILNAALDLVKSKGYEALSVRSVAQVAGCSTQPVYSFFGDMEGLINALYQHARAWVTEYNAKIAQQIANPFAANGRSHIFLAREEPRLFAFLYQSPYKDFENIEELFSSVAQSGVISFIRERGGMSEDAAHSLYMNMIVYTHGLATLIAAGADLPDEVIAPMMDAAFNAFFAMAAEKK